MAKVQGVLHQYTERLVAFEFALVAKKNVLIAVGGMGDGLLTVPYLTGLKDVLETLGYTLVQPQLSSSFTGWGASSLDQDIMELKQLVEYLRSEQGGSREKIILLGHSTGSQDVMHYLLHHPDTVEAAILQASVSDREAFGSEIDAVELDRLNEHAKELLSKGRGGDLLPTEYSRYLVNTPVTAYRWCSLMLPNGDDDYFSSDLSDAVLQKSFGNIRKPFLIAYSEADEFVPAFVDKSKLLERWKQASDPKMWSRHSGLIHDATHAVTDSHAQHHLFTTIKSFIDEFSL